MNFARKISPVCAALCIGLILLLHRADSAAKKKSDHDLVEVVSLDQTIVVDLPYATKNNFTKRVLYPVERCFLRRVVAERLVKVQEELLPKALGIKIWDGYRPHRVQYVMWDHSPLPGFVGNPNRGSRHNRGAAVDVTLVSLDTGEEIPMATPYDEFTKRAHAYATTGLSEEIKANRKILQDAMTRNGFKIMRTEWWHFDAVDWTRFSLKNIPLEDLAKQADAEKN